MSIVNSFRQQNSVIHLNDIIEEFKYVYRDTEVTAGDFVEFIEGIGVHGNYGNSTTILVGEIGSNNSTMCATLLNDGNIFVVYGGMNYFYGVVVTIEGSNIIPNTSVALSSTNNNAHSLSAVTLEDGKVFIVHNNYDKAPLYGLLCEINGTTITVVGTETQIGTSAYGSWGTVTLTSSSVLLDDGNVFVAHNCGSGSYVQHLYGVVVTINGTTITAGTDTALDTAEDQGCKISAKKLNNGNVFIAHGSGSSYLYAMVCTISGTTITAGTDTEIVSSSYTSASMSAEVLEENRIFIAFSYNSSYYYMCGIVCTVSGTTIGKGSYIYLVQKEDAAYDIATLKVGTNKVLIAHGGFDYMKAGVIATISGTTITAGTDTELETASGNRSPKELILLPNDTIFYGVSASDYGKIYGQIYMIDEVNNVPTNNIDLTTYEQQVMPTTQEYADAIALSSGKGGTIEGHNNQVKIGRVYKVIEDTEVTYTDDFLASAVWTQNSTTEYVSDKGLKITINTLNSGSEGTIDDAFDGDQETYWEVGYGVENWITLTLPEALALTKMSFTITGNTLFAETAYIQASNDNATWEQIGTFGTSYTYETQNITMSEPKYYKYYRVFMDQTQSNCTIEFREWQILEYKKKETVIIE